MTDLALIYLARGVGGGLKSAEIFFKNYQAYPPGCDHDFYVIAKGWDDEREINELRKLTAINKAKLIHLEDDGYDWGAYMRVTPCLESEWVCFLNTHSKPCAKGWLNQLMSVALTEGEEFGAAGATASWESLAKFTLPPAQNKKYRSIFHGTIRFLVNFPKFLLNIIHFPYFPNPHLRSNCFIVKRALFLEFTSEQTIPRSKRDASILESGRQGFSRYLEKKGLKMLVVNSKGEIFNKWEWKTAGTFRVPHQTGLLVSDNQTEMYAKSSHFIRQILEISAWGRA